MTRAVVDQDITPAAAVSGGLPDDWAVDVGVGSTVEAASRALAGADVALVTSRVPLTRAAIEAAGDLQAIGKLGTGIDSVDCRAAAERGVPVTHTPGYNALSVAEHALGLALATARRLTEARALVESGRWRDAYSLGTRLSGSTVGVVGFGDVGRRLGRLLTGFDVDLLVHDPYVPGIDAELVGGTTASFGTVVGESDVLVLATELTDETRGLVGAPEFERMRSSALLVNVSRGPVVDEDALVAALGADEIAGAGLDVFATEPLDPDDPLLSLESVVATPHVAAMTVQARTDGIGRLTTNVVRLVAGESVPDRFLATT
jgi:D-3-phosphoglycerate dehydrogenase